jgi:hypothetical protein
LKEVWRLQQRSILLRSVISVKDGESPVKDEALNRGPTARNGLRKRRGSVPASLFVCHVNG